METIKDKKIYVPDYDINLRNPLLQSELGWRVFNSNDIANVKSILGLRSKDPGEIFSSTEKILGKVIKWCVLGDNIIGAYNWEGVSFSVQHYAVHHGAAAFIASAMQYVKVKGNNAGKLLDMLSPRKLSELPVNSAKFVLFTNTRGGIDEESIVIRTKSNEFIMSCGGGRIPSWLTSIAKDKDFSDIEVLEGDVFSFNIKGPDRLAAVTSLIDEQDRSIVQRLRSFNSCIVRSTVGGAARVLKTIIGYEVWADEETLVNIWLNLITQHPEIVPCGWELLNAYRVECDLIPFTLYPLDIHSGTTLWEINCGWMIDKNDSREYIGKDALFNLEKKRRFWLSALIANENCEIPPIGSKILSYSGAFVGYVTTAAFSPKYDRVLLFAHLLPNCLPKQVVLVGEDSWHVTTLPFLPTHLNP